MKTTENNKLIATFMGMSQGKPNEQRFKSDWFEQLIVEGNSFETGRKHTYLHFDTDWNWLMEVVNKCLGICHEKMLNEWEDGFSDSFFSRDINCLYSETVRFIKWYNEQK